MHTSLFRIQGCFASRLFFAYSMRLFRIQGFFAHEAVLHVRPLCYKAGLLKSLLSIQGFFASRLFCTRVCLSYKAVSHTTLFRILGSFRLLDVSYTNLFRIQGCFASRLFRIQGFPKLSFFSLRRLFLHTRLFRIRDCFVSKAASPNSVVTTNTVTCTVHVLGTVYSTVHVLGTAHCTVYMCLAIPQDRNKICTVHTYI